MVDQEWARSGLGKAATWPLANHTDPGKPWGLLEVQWTRKELKSR